MGRMSGSGDSGTGGGFFGINSGGTGVRYMCLVCSNKHKGGACPRCGSKMQRPDFQRIKMALDEIRKKVLYQNSIEVWIGISKEKNIDWVDTENYKKFIAFLLKNNLNMKQMSICF